MHGRRTWRNKAYSAWDVFWIKCDFLISTTISRISLHFQGCSPASDFATSGKCSFKARTEGSIRIGKGVTFLAAWRTNRVGLSGPVLLQTEGGGLMEIGDHSGGSSVVISARSHIVIGRHVNLGGNVRIFDHDFHALDPECRKLGHKEQSAYVRTEPIYIGDEVFIGTNSMILKGVRLGERSLVAAGSVVFRGDYPPDALLRGNPAVVVTRKTSAPAQYEAGTE